MAVKKAESKVAVYIATGRRKRSIARARMTAGKGIFLVNDKNLKDYFGEGTYELVATQPLVLTGTLGKYDITVSVNGGGLTGQAGAVRHAIARVLVKADESLKTEIKKAGYLTRDPREKERKKYGLKKARKAPQFRKR